MKKLLSLVLFACLLILPVNPIFAADEPVSFLDALGNLSKIEDYKLVQSFYGNVEYNNETDNIGAEYRISISSAVDNGASADSFNRINAYLKFTNHNEVSDSTPFKEMTVQASGELIALNQTDLYVKLSDFNVGLTDSRPFALADIENAKSMVEPFKGVWYHAGVEELATENLTTEMSAQIDVDKYIGIEEQFKEDPKEAILGLTEMMLQDSESGLTEEDTANILEAVKMALETKFFIVKQMVAGQNAGFNFFTLNKSSIIGFLEQFATLIGEELTAEDEAMFRSVLSKVNLSGIYRIEGVYGLIDNLLMRFKMNETGPIKNLELNYRYKASDLNKNNVISAPSEYEELSDLTGSAMDAEADF